MARGAPRPRSLAVALAGVLGAVLAGAENATPAETATPAPPQKGAASGAGAAAAAKVEQDVELITVTSADGGVHYYPGLSAKRASALAVAAATTFLPGYSVDNEKHGFLGHGCSEADYGNASAPAFVAVVGSAGCTAAEKAAVAKAKGAILLIVVSDNSSFPPLPANGTEEAVPVVGVLWPLGELLANGTWANAAAKVEVAEYKRPGMFSTSQCVVIALATCLVMAGAFVSTSDLRPGSPITPASEEVVEVDGSFPLHFCAMGSLTLTILYFFMKYLIYVVIAFFCLSGAATLMEIGAMILGHYVPKLQRDVLYFPYIGVVEFAQAISGVVACAVVGSWLWFRNTDMGWLPQDIIGTGFLCFMQRTLRLPNLQLAAATLSVMFFFDIFWVFLSPLIFAKSVMVEVATGGGTGQAVPLLLRVPAFGDPLGNESLLGFGDVALPGLLISFTRRFDLLSMKPLHKGYFLPCVAGYFVGMVSTMVALSLMQKGQPALLYLVPGTLGTTLALGAFRGELGYLWSGTPTTPSGGEALMGGEYHAVQELSGIANCEPGLKSASPESFVSAGPAMA